MFLTRILLLMGTLLISFPLHVLGWDWQTRVTVVVKEQPLQAVCELLEKEYGINFSYSKELIDLSRKVTLSTYRQPLKNVLTDLFAPADIRFTRVGDLLVLSPSQRTIRTICGYIKDAVSGENLIGATIYSPLSKQGTVTNQYGYFSITIDKNINSLVISYINYNPFLQIVPGKGDKMINVPLQPSGHLKEVIVIAAEESKLQHQTQMSKVQLSTSAVQSMPRLLGEVDVMRTLQSMPGVSGGMDGAGGLHVRGGSPDQNLTLIDGAPVFNFSHFFGVYSLLNADVVKSTDLYKGAFPARFGGRLSGVVDITMKDGDMKTYHGDAAIGLIAAKFNLEGPIIKNKTAFMVSARRSYPDLIVNAVMSANNVLGRGGTFKAYFYDLNVKINHIISPKDRMFFNVYAGKDNFMLKQMENDSATLDPFSKREQESGKFQMGWGNTIASLRWNHIYGTKMFSSVTMNYSQYAFFTAYGQKYVIPAAGQKTDLYGNYFSYLQHEGTKIDFDYRPAPQHSLRFGASATMQHFKPGRSTFKDKDSQVQPLDTLNPHLHMSGVEMSLYAEDDWQLRPGLHANLGMHVSGFKVEKRFYHSLQPRLGIHCVLPRNWALKAAYTRMNQYVHLLSNSGTTLPTDIWVPSTQRVAPMYSSQLVAGAGKTSDDLRYEFLLEGYYKSMANMIENKESTATIFRNADRWDETVTVGKGWSYGAEVMMQKKKGRTTGWVGYTLSWSGRRFPGINNGNIFPYKYDQRHDLEIVITQKLGKRWELSASWHYTTGRPITLPVSSYSGIDYASPWEPGASNYFIDHYDKRYNYRTTDLHRLDASITYSKQKKCWRKSWNLSIYNVYNQQNPFFYYMTVDEKQQQRYLAKVSILPVLPSITYSIKF